MLCAPAHLLTRLTVMLRLCAGACTNCSLCRFVGIVCKVISLSEGHFSWVIHYLLFGGMVEIRLGHKV